MVLPLPYCVGEQIGIWFGVCTGEMVVSLVVVATKGYHSLSKYEWMLDGRVLAKELFPVIYATCQGHYSCEVKIASIAISHKIHFNVIGKTLPIFNKLTNEYTFVISVT